ncbi:MAG: Uncharacterised protein [Synechococcus sp. CC9902]|nr:MAG: Uncharacterised protein [Synechococcus sp. CC9902]
MFQRRALLRKRQLSVQKVHLPTAQGRCPLQQLPAAIDFRDSRQENENTAAPWKRQCMGLKSPQDLLRQPFIATGRLVKGFHRKSTSLTAQDHSLWQSFF